MRALPFVLVRHGADVIPVLAGVGEQNERQIKTLVGIDIVDGRMFEYEVDDVVGAVSCDPAGVFYGLELASAASQRMAAESRTKSHTGPTYYGGRPEGPPPPETEPERWHNIIAGFLESVEGEGPDYLNDPRVPKILAALRTLDIPPGEDVEVLGRGSFGTAIAISHTRVLKLTADPSEVQAGAVLVGKHLAHVVDVYGAWFIAGARMRVPYLDVEGEEEELVDTRIGVILEERVDAVPHGDPTRMRLSRVVRDLKNEFKVWPQQLRKMKPAKARAHLASVAPRMAIELENSARLGALGAGVAAGIRELAELGIYAVDVHGGNVGHRGNGEVVLFDIGSSSPPKQPKAGVIDTRAAHSAHPPIAPLETPVAELYAPSEVPSQAAEAKVRRFAPRGMRFQPLTGYAVTGYPEVRQQLLRHRAEVPSTETIRLSAIFAGSTIMVGIEQAEKSFACIADLFKRRGSFPTVEEIRECILSIGLLEMRSRMYQEVAAWAPAVRQAIVSGLKDNELRQRLVLHTELPTGLSLAKVSFTLALLGHDCICLDARLLGRMFGDRGREVANGWSKGGELGLKRYEAVEEAFLKGNPFYRPTDPLGRARAQWMSWEAVGGAPATHSVWLSVVR